MLQSPRLHAATPDLFRSYVLTVGYLFVVYHTSAWIFWQFQVDSFEPCLSKTLCEPCQGSVLDGVLAGFSCLRPPEHAQQEPVRFGQVNVSWD